MARKNTTFLKRWFSTAFSRDVYRRCEEMASHPGALSILALLAFFESIILPLPPDILLAAMVLAHPSKAWVLASVTTVASAVGGLAGYVLGYAAFDWIGRPILAFYGLDGEFEVFAAEYRDYGVWIVAAGAFTFLPYKFFTIASGVVGMNVLAFFLVSVVARGARFFLVAALLRWCGPNVMPFIEKRLMILLSVGFAVMIGGFVVLGYWEHIG